MARDFVFSPGTTYSCINCGRCCTHWGISVDEKTAANLLKYDWGAHYPDMKHKTVMVKRKSAIEGGESYFMKMRLDGRCPFLDDGKFCRIHRDLGYDAKPLTCKRFPLELVMGRRAVYARLSFYCPAVAAGEGEPLGAQRRWMETCLRGGGTHSLPEEMYWAEGLRMSPSDVAELDGYLLDIVRSAGRQLSERLGRKIAPGQYNHIADSFHIYGSYFGEFEAFLKSIETRTFDQRVFSTEDVADIIQEARQQIAASLEAEKESGRKGL